MVDLHQETHLWRTSATDQGGFGTYYSKSTFLDHSLATSGSKWIPSPSNHGWRKYDDYFEPVMTTKPSAPAFLLEMMTARVSRGVMTVYFQKWVYAAWLIFKTKGRFQNTPFNEETLQFSVDALQLRGSSTRGEPPAMGLREKRGAASPGFPTMIGVRDLETRRKPPVQAPCYGRAAQREELRRDLDGPSPRHRSQPHGSTGNVLSRKIHSHTSQANSQARHSVKCLGE